MRAVYLWAGEAGPAGHQPISPFEDASTAEAPIAGAEEGRTDGFPLLFGASA